MLNIIEDFIPAGRRNRPGWAMKPEYISIHETDNYNHWADAKNHAAYLKGQIANDRPVSWHYTVDDKEAYKHLPTSETGYHAGDGQGPGNMSSIGIEICVNDDGDFTLACEHAAELTAILMTVLKIPIENVVQHNHWSGKDCPHRLRQGNKWQEWLDRVDSYLNPVDEKEELRKQIRVLTAERDMLKDKLKAIRECVTSFSTITK